MGIRDKRMDRRSLKEDEEGVGRADDGGVADMVREKQERKEPSRRGSLSREEGNLWLHQ